MTANFTIMPIVEGDGEVQAMPILIRRICGELFDRYDVKVRSPWRIPRSKIVRAEDLEPVLRVLTRAAPEGRGGVLLVLDLDDDACPVQLADRVSACNNTDLPLEVVVATREFEAWFLGSISSLRTHKSVQDDADYDGDAETPRNAKGRLESLMTESYKETLHQSSFSQQMSLQEAQHSCRSFMRMVSGVGKLIGVR